MKPDQVQALLEAVARGESTVEDAVDRLRTMPFLDLGFAKLDTHRPLRTGQGEVVFGEGKSLEQLIEIVEALAAETPPVLVTRLSRPTGETLAQRFAGSRFHRDASALVVGSLPEGRGKVAVLSAGTSDLPVAAEAALTAEVLGSNVECHWDVGVAGLQRLLTVREELDGARVVVAVAGMEGALPSVVGGLVAVPVIAVPTSVGYGASFGGLAALLGMLNSCAPGVSAVNIDNGFGAGYLAHMINSGTER